MDINTKIYDRVVDHLTDVRLYEEGVQLQNRRIMQRHRKRLRDILMMFNLKSEDLVKKC